MCTCDLCMPKRKACGHSSGLLCGCSIWTDAKIAAYNGLCQCRGPLSPHPLHVIPLPPEYVGKHRPKE